MEDMLQSTEIMDLEPMEGAKAELTAEDQATIQNYVSQIDITDSTFVFKATSVVIHTLERMLF